MADKTSAIQDALKGTEAADNKDVIAAFADGWSVAESQTGGRRRGGMPPKKAAKEDPPPEPVPIALDPPPSIPAAARRAVANTAEFAGQVGRAGAGAAANAIIAAPFILAAGGGGALALNNPTMFGNIVQVVADVLVVGTDVAIRTTWADWREAAMQIGNAIGVLGEAAVAQSIQGPVVPFAIAAAAVAYASRTLPGGAVGLLGSMSLYAKKLKFTLPTTQGKRHDASALRELGLIAKKNAPFGPGAAAIAATFRGLGIPAVESGVGGIATVSATRQGDERELRAALGSLARIPVGEKTGTGSKKAAEAAAAEAAARARGAAGSGEIGDRDAAGDGDAVMVPTEDRKRDRPQDEAQDTGAGVFPPSDPKKPKPDDGKGGRRKTKKRKSKKRMTRRKNCTVVKFAY